MVLNWVVNKPANTVYIHYNEITDNTFCLWLSLKPHSNGPLYSNTAIGTLAADEQAVTFSYSEEGSGRAAAPPSPLLAAPNVTVHPSTASIPTSYYSICHYNNQVVPASRGSAPSNRIWNNTTLRSPKQQIWLPTALCGGWCRRMVLRNLKVAYQKRGRLYLLLHSKALKLVFSFTLLL